MATKIKADSISWQNYLCPKMKLNDKQKLFLKTIKENPDRTLEELGEIAHSHFTFGLIAEMVRRQIVEQSEKPKTIIKDTDGKCMKTEAHTYRIGKMADRNVTEKEQIKTYVVKVTGECELVVKAKNKSEVDGIILERCQDDDFPFDIFWEVENE